ncbi:MAG TPA: nitrous oxide reductase family maturation protein NosD [Myxococcota bacterium]
MAAARRALRERAPIRRALLAALALAAAGPAFARPEACREIPPGANLQQAVDAAPPGSSLCLAPGDYAGPVRIATPLTLEGPRDAVIRSSGEGTTVRLEGEGGGLLGVTIDGSGGRYDLLDGAVHVTGRGGRVEGVLVRNAVFGILVERATNATVRGNHVLGGAGQTLGLRGDGIRLWETYDSTIEDNRLEDSRDVVLWYASRNRVAGNRIERGRYGAHLMYSHDNQLVGNRFIGNVTGLFVMYSRDVEIRDNVFADSGGAAGMGLGVKESGNLRVIRNLFVHNTIGVYVDTSPLWPDDRNRFEGNLFRLNGIAVSFLGRASGNEFRGNGFRDSQVQVQVDGRGDAREALWRGNEFDDYAGYDLAGDGTGDVPYELRSLTSDLVAESPALAFFRGTPAFALAEAIGRIVPLFEPRLVLSDPEPRMARVAWEGPGAD